jgi:plasmid stabilization system protein ParE
MERLIYDPLAKLEIKEAAAFYENYRQGLGRAFLETIEKAIQRVRENPLQNRRIAGRFRRRLVNRFPYGVIYSIEVDHVFIVAVMHLKREPNYWKQRLQK